MNSPKQKVLIRTAPDPKEGQNRVRETVKSVVEKLTDTRPDNIKDDINLGQLIIPKDVDKRVGERMKQVPQDQAVIEYLDGTIEGANPLLDIAPGMKKLEKAIYRLNVPQVIQKIATGGEIKPGRPISRFVMVRHGDKQPDGTLSEKGIQEALKAGVYTRSIHDGGDIPVTGVFGVQQPNVQMIMSALQIGTHWNKEEKDAKTVVKENWNSLPKSWKEPYRTGEITLFDIVLSSEFDINTYKKLAEEEKGKYIRKMLQIRIQRNAHTETYNMNSLDVYDDVLKTFQEQ